MQVTGSAIVSAPLQDVWDALQDPAVLARTIPGCQSLEPVGPDRYRMTVSAGVASIRGTYAGEVRLAEPDPPRAFVLQARGQGAPGTVEATVRVSLSPAPRDGDGQGDGGDGGESGGDGSTRVDYDAEAVVGGMVGGVGQRMLAAVAKRTAAQFFAAVEDDLTRPEPRVERPLAGGPAQGAGGRVAARVPAVPPSEGGRVVHEGRRDERRPAPSPWPMAAAFVTGGAVALAGVALGHALARRARGPA